MRSGAHAGRVVEWPSQSVAKVIDALIQAPGLTRAELGMRVGLTRAPVGMALTALSERGFIEQRVEPERDGSRATGRPPLRIYLARDAGYSIALDVGTTELRGGVFDLMGNELAAGGAETGSAAGPDAVLEAVSELALELLGAADVEREAVLGIGIGLSAPLGAGTLEKAALERLAGLPVIVDDSANLGALGERHFGAGRGCDDMLYVRLSSGIGLGMIIAGRLYRGASGVAGGLGHMSLTDSGPLCACGNRGCVEALAGPGAIADAVPGAVAVGDVIRAAAGGDRRARRALADAGAVIGQALAAAVTLVDPRLVVVGGELAAAGEQLIEPLSAAVERCAIPATRIVVGELGARAELLGAAMLHLPSLSDVLVRRVAAA